MKKISVPICVYLWLILLGFSINAQDFKTLQDGIEYAEMTRQIDKLPVKINLLRLDLTKVRLDVVHAMDAMNLDGGGSTTMFLDGKIVNRPSDKEGERKVSDAILVFPRKK